MSRSIILLSNQASQGTNEREIYSGYNLSSNAFKDIECCFKKSQRFKFAKEYNSKIRGHVAYCGSGKTAKIKLSKEFCEYEIKTLTDYFFVLMILCHEIAHYFHDHNRFKDSSALDAKAIETQADFFSARVMLTVVTFGERNREILYGLNKELNQSILLEETGKALRRVYDFIYCQNSSKSYPDPITRVIAFLAGVQSFFIRYFREMKRDWSLYVFKKIMDSGNFIDIPEFSEGSQFDVITSQRIYPLHKKIQGLRIGILYGLKPQFENLLNADYSVEQWQVDRSTEYVNNTVKSWFEGP